MGTVTREELHAKRYTRSFKCEALLAKRSQQMLPYDPFFLANRFMRIVTCVSLQAKRSERNVMSKALREGASVSTEGIITKPYCGLRN